MSCDSGETKKIIRNENSMSSQEQIKQWEQVEIERSTSEASHIDAAHLAYSESNLARYRNPPADTCFPLEYSYHLLGDVRGKSVLDFGCGSGENTVFLAQRGARVYAMDISESLMKVAKRRLAVNGFGPGVSFLCSSAYSIALADESVDVVFGIAILHHLDLSLAAREVRRVLRKGGRAIFQEPVRNSKLMRRIREMIPYQAPDVSPFERPLTDQELKDFAQGYSAYKSRAFVLPYVNLAQLLPVSRRFVHPLSRLDAVMLRNFPALGYYATVRVIEMVK
jgi:ubiquinone/menaquinone biosynthesis C-methylase UbiE